MARTKTEVKWGNIEHCHKSDLPCINIPIYVLYHFLRVQSSHGNVLKLRQMELDGLRSYHELQSPEPEQELEQEEGKEHDVDGPLQGQHNGVYVAQEVDGEGNLKEGEQPESSQLCNLE